MNNYNKDNNYINGYEPVYVDTPDMHKPQHKYVATSDLFWWWIGGILLFPLIPFSILKSVRYLRQPEYVSTENLIFWWVVGLMFALPLPVAIVKTIMYFKRR